jgi:formate dehydrogenase major subunit
MGGGRVIHQVALPWHWGFAAPPEGVTGDSTNDLGALSGDPNTSIQESKAFTCNVRAGRRDRPSTAKLAGVHRSDVAAGVNEDHDAEELPR